MRQAIIASLNERMEAEISNRASIRFLKKIDIESILDQAVTIAYLYTRSGKRGRKDVVLMAEVIAAIGHSIRNKAGLKKDSSIAAKTGAFVLYTFELAGILHVKKGRGGNGHATYIVVVDDEPVLAELWSDISEEKTEKLPSLTPYAPWSSFVHETGARLVKTQSKAVQEALKIESQPIVFNTVNRAQEVGWNVNESVYDIFTWALRNKTNAFSDIWEMQNPEAKSSKIREAKAVGEIAKRFIGKTFYHLYYLDFRARKYAASAYFHEQGMDLSKGMLLRADKKAIGEQGFYWLMISIASNWAGDAGRPDGQKTDKIPLNDRVYWSLDNEEIILSYAENPKVNQGWMDADKPWQFLAACLELKKLRDWQEENEPGGGGVFSLEIGMDYDEYGYESHLECFIDGSNNGSQHLSALTRDEVTAPHVNLVPLDLPGDLYKYVADHVWEKINWEVSAMSAAEIRECDSVIDTLTDMKTQINTAVPNSDRKKKLVEELVEFKQEFGDLIKAAAPVYWSRITDSKHKRKIVKRNVMTLPYGGTAYGLGQQVIDDSRKHGISSLMTMEHKWGSYMGHMVYEDCKESLEKPMRLLSIFEQAGKKAELEDRFLQWEVPITHFPVVQHYTEGIVKKIWVQYGPPAGAKKNTGHYANTYQLRICFIEKVKPSKRKQSQGASPNAIHSLDAAHLMLLVEMSDFYVTTVHDSFGCLLGDMSELFIITREAFVRLYNSNPLESLMGQIGGDISNVEIGNLNIEDVLDSEYAFA